MPFFSMLAREEEKNRNQNRRPTDMIGLITDQSKEAINLARPHARAVNGQICANTGTASQHETGLFRFERRVGGTCGKVEERWRNERILRSCFGVKLVDGSRREEVNSVRFWSQPFVGSSATTQPHCQLLVKIAS